MKKTKKKRVPKLKVSTIRLSLSPLFNGSLWDVILKNLSSILIFVAVVLAYISLRFNCQVKLAEIEKLTLLLEQKRSIVISQTSEMVKKTNQGEVLRMIQERKLDLKASTTPPYVIKQ